MQIIEAVCETQTLPHMAQNLLCPESEASIIYQQFTNVDLTGNKLIVSTNCVALGMIERKAQLSNPLHQEALMKITFSQQLGTFKRATVKQIRFTLYRIPKLRGETAILYPMNTTVNLIMERYYTLLQISLKVTPLLYPSLIV